MAEHSSGRTQQHQSCTSLAILTTCMLRNSLKGISTKQELLTIGSASCRKKNGACSGQAPLSILLIYIVPHMQDAAQNFGLVFLTSLNKESEQCHYRTTQVTKMDDMKKSKNLYNLSVLNFICVLFCIKIRSPML